MGQQSSSPSHSANDSQKFERSSSYRKKKDSCDIGIVNAAAASPLSAPSLSQSTGFKSSKPPDLPSTHRQLLHHTEHDQQQTEQPPLPPTPVAKQTTDSTLTGMVTAVSPPQPPPPVGPSAPPMERRSSSPAHHNHTSLAGARAGTAGPSGATNVNTAATANMCQVSLGDYSEPIDFRRKGSSVKERQLPSAPPLEDVDPYSEPYQSKQNLDAIEALKRQQSMTNEPDNFDYELAKPVFDLVDTSGVTTASQTDSTSGSSILEVAAVECSPAHGRRVSNAITPLKLPDNSPGGMRGPIASLPKLPDGSPCRERDQCVGGSGPSSSSLQAAERQYSSELDSHSQSSASSHPSSPTGMTVEMLSESSPIREVTMESQTYEEPWDSELRKRQLEEKVSAAGIHSLPSPTGDGRLKSQQVGTGNYEEPWDLARRQKLLHEKLGLAEKSNSALDSDYLEPRSVRKQPSSSMYEEPWDSAAKQKMLEEKFQASHIKTSPKHQVSGVPSLSSGNWAAGDDAGQGNYEVPWDYGERAKAINDLMTGRAPEYRPMSSPPSEAPPSPSHKHRGHWVKQPRPQLPRQISDKSETFDPTAPLTKQKWYHGNISRLQAEQLLRVCREGSYLVRRSTSSKGEFSLSIKGCRSIMHIRIANRNELYILGEFSEPFRTVPDMIHYYGSNILRIKDADHLHLRYPVSVNMA
ncbi:SH2 domain-containing adapter protein B isoform X2 [Octopus bimaculoides]|uniref:SH2 domain-containing adapter protein B isoform X2 n=1 Tax=Octopus bimaculoides TaxID=37653 RepID=UPI00071E6036|nr:SH2 domain-containing adapter protein B isoform X2 [Octopus bimaculoides]|eukprot:XP_014772511.1 PREDICTED: SH2 domain-containing adapter protein B-like isoform X2 [Octopus bimaculoides]